VTLPLIIVIAPVVPVVTLHNSLSAAPFGLVTAAVRRNPRGHEVSGACSREVHHWCRYVVRRVELSAVSMLDEKLAALERSRHPQIKTGLCEMSRASFSTAHPLRAAE
jgi:hypothetical protein